MSRNQCSKCGYIKNPSGYCPTCYQIKKYGSPNRDSSVTHTGHFVELCDGRRFEVLERSNGSRFYKDGIKEKIVRKNQKIFSKVGTQPYTQDTQMRPPQDSVSRHSQSLEDEGVLEQMWRYQYSTNPELVLSASGQKQSTYATTRPASSTSYSGSDTDSELTKSPNKAQAISSTAHYTLPPVQKLKAETKTLAKKETRGDPDKRLSVATEQYRGTSLKQTLPTSTQVELKQKIQPLNPMRQKMGTTPSVQPKHTFNVCLESLDTASLEWVQICDCVFQTMPQATIKNIQRVKNKWLWDRYDFAKKRMSKKNGGIVNEKALFHGTSEIPPDKIIRSEYGFDFRCCTDGKWGIGTYFAVNASYSNSYSYRSPSSKDRVIIMALVLTGESCRCEQDRKLRRPPVKTRAGEEGIDEHYDTVCGHIAESDVYIVYDHEKVYPSYLISYTVD